MSESEQERDLDLHGWDIPGSLPPMRLVAGMLRTRQRPALWLTGGNAEVMIASFHSVAAFRAFVRALDLCFTAINHVIALKSSEKKTG